MSPGARRPRAREALRSGSRPLPGSPCPAPAALHPEDLMPEHGAEGARPRGARMRTPPSEAGIPTGSVGAEVKRVPSAEPGRFASCRLQAAAAAGGGRAHCGAGPT